MNTKLDADEIIDVRPIGIIGAPRTEADDDDWGRIESRIALDPLRLDASAVLGLDQFSHLEVVYFFHRVPATAIQRGARRPRGNEAWPEVGILAQRAKSRPNRLGVSHCELLSVDGLELKVRGLDAIDGTPVLDIKPHIQEFDVRGPVRQPSWTHELMRSYW
jgi:tRNA (adenine37-N6)-methyltransferase